MLYTSINDTIFIRMTVSEIINHLQQFPPNMLVVVSGYEGGYDDPGMIHIVKLQLLDYDSDYHGKYMDHNEGESIKAVVIPRL